MPLLIKKLVGLNPVAVILAILVGAKLGGILGVLLAVPIAAVIDELCDDLAKRKSIPSIPRASRRASPRFKTYTELKKQFLLLRFE